MSKIPMPVVIVLVVVAVVVLAWSVRRSTGAGSKPPIPTGPPSGEAMQHMRDSAAQGRDRSGGMILPGGMGSPSGR